MVLSELRNLITTSYQPCEYPALGYQTECWSVSQPLKGVTILDATPVYRNTVAKYIALLAAGAELTIGISDIMSRDERIVEFLRQTGLSIVQAEKDTGGFDIILDCAASFSAWTARKGYVELTRSGVDTYARCEKPVYVADSGTIKKIETSLGTGEGYFRAMHQLGYSDWKGRLLVVFGSGKVGTGIITYAHQAGAKITVITDPATAGELVRRCAEQIIDYRDTPGIISAVSQAYAVVTATGVAHAVEQCCPPDILVKSTALLANMGVEDEYGPNIPDSRVLRDKNALNFILDEPTHLKYIDATMALHNAGAVYLASGNPARGLITPPKETEVELLSATRRSGCITQELELILKA